MPLELESYRAQERIWPGRGRHILAQYDDDSVVVYQAYRPAIGHFAAHHGFLGGDFSLERMSWVKPNFLWMMYRSGWGTKLGQEVVLAVRIKRGFFDEILAGAVHSSHVAEVYGSHDQWKRELSASEVRLQWDPDHLPRGGKHERRAIQLGLRGEMLRRYARDEVIEIEDISELVAVGRRQLDDDLEKLITPRERAYWPEDERVRTRLGLSAAAES